MLLYKSAKAKLGIIMTNLKEFTSFTIKLKVCGIAVKYKYSLKKLFLDILVLKFKIYIKRSSLDWFILQFTFWLILSTKNRDIKKYLCPMQKIQQKVVKNESDNADILN